MNHVKLINYQINARQKNKKTHQNKKRESLSIIVHYRGDHKHKKLHSSSHVNRHTTAAIINTHKIHASYPVRHLAHRYDLQPGNLAEYTEGGQDLLDKLWSGSSCGAPHHAA